MRSRLNGFMREARMAPRSQRTDKFGNRLLDAMAPKALDRIRRHLETVVLEVNQAIHQPGEIAKDVFFPTQGLISIVTTMSDGASVEIGMVGKEGVFSVSAILGDDRPPQNAMVQLPGRAFRMPSQLLRQEAQADTALQAQLLRYVQAKLSMAGQAAACNRLHTLEQRCARWLLSAHDRAEGDSFPMTHEFMSMMLGVRRAGVTVAAQGLQSRALITYHRGTMSILDREGLEASSCECYHAIQAEFSRLLGWEGRTGRAPGTR